ncbi:unnamed protein product [Ectocarpus sp. 12 AP-2014]
MIGVKTYYVLALFAVYGCRSSHISLLSWRKRRKVVGTAVYSTVTGMTRAILLRAGQVFTCSAAITTSSSMAGTQSSVQRPTSLLLHQFPYMPLVCTANVCYWCVTRSPPRTTWTCFAPRSARTCSSA